MVTNKKQVSYVWSKSVRYLKNIGLCLLFFIIQYRAYSLAPDTSLVNPKFFEQVSRVYPTNRIELITKSQLDEKPGKTAGSIFYRKKFQLNKDSLAKRNNTATIEKVKLRWEFDKHITQLNKLRSEEKMYAIKMYAGIAVLTLLVIISILIYNRQRLKNKKDKELLIAEKRIVDEELKSAATALQIFTENLREKNNLIEQFKQEIDRLNQLSASKENAVQLEKLLQAHIMTNESWNSFKKLFLKVYPGFFINLNKNHPHLSSTDVRMLALIKLGLNNTEMANMLGITVEGIKKAKQRLRKKINIDAIKTTDNNNIV